MINGKGPRRYSRRAGMGLEARLEEASVREGFMQWFLCGQCGTLFGMSFPKLHIWVERGGRLCFKIFWSCFGFCLEGARVTGFVFFNAIIKIYPKQKTRNLALHFNPEKHGSIIFPLNGGRGMRALGRDLVFHFMELLEDITCPS